MEPVRRSVRRMLGEGRDRRDSSWSSYSRTEGWSENKDDLLGTVLRGISGSGCEDDVERKREQPGMEATSENMHSMHFMAIFAIEAGRWITLRNALLHYARLRTV